MRFDVVKTLRVPVSEPAAVRREEGRSAESLERWIARGFGANGADEAMQLLVDAADVDLDGIITYTTEDTDTRGV